MLDFIPDSMNEIILSLLGLKHLTVVEFLIEQDLVGIY